MNQYRTVGALAADFTGRTVEGLLLPYDSPREITAPGFRGRETIARGAADHQLRAADRIPFYLDHGPLGGKLIGRVDNLRSAQDGLYGRAIISRTSAGNDAIELIRDGVYRAFSVGFSQVRGMEVRQADGGILRKKINLFELAAVQAGAYSDATIAALRSAGDRCATCGQFGQADAHEAETDEERMARESAEAADSKPNLTAAGNGLAPLPLSIFQIGL